ncbi:MAG: cytochrome P460 family protein [Nitrosomonas sp.]|nr:cytochrome P460 family protein [Nitrosomonas sp.]MDP1949711.1 cytochrome P460 family protein [Nitrosomonas sp.]
MSQLRKTLLGGIAPLLLSGMLISQVAPVSASGASAHHGHQAIYARFTKDNELLRPRDYREWVFIGAPLTPNDMNDGSAVFPEFHNVYIDPASWAHWKKTGEFRSGTVIVKELVSVGTKEAASGHGYFQGEFNGIAAMTKDTERFADRPGNWAFFGFESYEARRGTLQADEACSACHKENAKQDMVFIQYYPVLRAAKPGK